nr:uncharacterized protein LOC112016755 [Quercus suber]
MGEEAMFSDSDHSGEEDAPRNPDRECAPLIDPWYNPYPLFPEVPGDYAPPLPGLVWLSMCRRNPNVSWAPVSSSISDLVIRQGVSLPVPIHFVFGSGTASGWKEWVDRELPDSVFMGLLQRAGILKSIVLSRSLSNFRDTYNLRHLVRRWCATTHTFFFSCGELTVTLEDVANQLLLPILGDVDPATIELSPEEEAIEAELRKGMAGNAKLSYWVSSSSKFSVVAHRAAFVAFWLCKFIFGSHPHYAIKPLYFRLAIKISAEVSLPLAPMFLGHLYVQLDILRSDESQAGSCHIVASSIHSTILQQLLFERCAQYLAKCRPVRFARETYQSCPRVITDFCGRFESDFPLAFRWSGLKPIGHSIVKSFDSGTGFTWRAYRSLGKGYTCTDSAMGPFTDIIGTTTHLTGFDEVGITYLAATNVGWLPYLTDEGIRFVHYPANRVRRQFGLDQDIPDDISYLMESPTSVRPFLR